MPGWVATAVTVIVADTWLIKNGRKSMSRCYWESHSHPWHGAVAFGVLAGIVHHLVVPPTMGD